MSSSSSSRRRLAAASASSAAVPHIGLGELIALIVSSCIGTGIFGITNDLSRSTAAGPALIGWAITGVGILLLVLSINNLALKRPDLTSGIFAYAGEISPLAEFVSGWSYWLSAWLGNIAFATMMMSALGTFIPAFRSGQNLASILVGAAIMCLITWLVVLGVEEASFLNLIGTICKIAPLVLFVIIMAVSFRADVFTAGFWGNVATAASRGTVTGSVWTQVRGALMTMIWVFIGVEGASVVASRAKSVRDTTVSAVVSLFLVWAAYVLISILPYGVLTRHELASMSQPAIGEVLQCVVGPWGAAVINVGLIISCFFALLSWSILPAETMRLLADDGVLSPMWGRLNSHRAPAASLWITCALQVLFLFSLLVTDQAYETAYGLCTAAVLYSYLLVGLDQMRVSRRRREWGQWTVGLLATAFQVLCMVIAGWREVMVVTVSFLIGFLLYVRARHLRGRKITAGETVWMVLLSAVGVAAIVLMACGVIRF